MFLKPLHRASFGRLVPLEGVQLSPGHDSITQGNVAALKIRKGLAHSENLHASWLPAGQYSSSRTFRHNCTVRNGGYRPLQASTAADGAAESQERTNTGTNLEEVISYRAQELYYSCGARKS